MGGIPGISSLLFIVYSSVGGPTQSLRLLSVCSVAPGEVGMRQDEARDLHLDLVTCDSCLTSCSLSLGVAEPWSAPQPGNWPFTPVSLPWGSTARGARQDPGGSWGQSSSLLAQLAHGHRLRLPPARALHLPGMEEGFMCALPRV